MQPRKNKSYVLTFLLLLSPLILNAQEITTVTLSEDPWAPCTLSKLNVPTGGQELTIYGDSNYPPYSYEENGQAKGIYVNILEAAFSKMTNYNVTIKMIPWKKGMKYLKQGKIVALFPPYYSNERNIWIHFSEPILEEKVAVFGKPENLEGKTKWTDDFHGESFGINRGFGIEAVGGIKFAKSCHAGTISVEEIDTTKQSLMLLMRDRITFYINDRFIDITSYPSIKCGMIINTNYGHLGFTRKSEKYNYLPDFKQKLDKIIQQMKAANEINTIFDKYAK